MSVVRANGARVRDLRRSKGWEQADLAQVSQCSPKTIQSVEAGRRVSLRTVVLIAQAFGVDHNELLVEFVNVLSSPEDVAGPSDTVPASSAPLDRQSGQALDAAQVSAEITIDRDLRSWSESEQRALLDLLAKLLEIRKDQQVLVKWSQGGRSDGGVK